MTIELIEPNVFSHQGTEYGRVGLRQRPSLGESWESTKRNDKSIDPFYFPTTKTREFIEENMWRNYRITERKTESYIASVIKTSRTETVIINVDSVSQDVEVKKENVEKEP